MKILVAIKRVVDPNVLVRAKPDGSGADIAGAKTGVNPFDENAIEEAVRLKEKGIATEIVAVTLGTNAHQDVLRHALAMGADRALLVETDVALQPLGVAKLLKAVIGREQPALILLGKQAIDDDAGQTGQMLAALLGAAQATFVSALAIEGDEAVVTREIEGGSERIAVTLPAVLTVDLRLNDPRFVKLPNLMMAKKKPIEILSAAELNADIAPRITQIKVSDPPARKPGIKVNDARELIAKLQEEGVLP
ncbi:MAG: electron transfer flavoprotein subunit beta/FixA family protein [Methylobacillus sp.]|nr:electron transfer flavoprotein subunit beta/FixA family protein [Methylobacillus sp.]